MNLTIDYRVTLNDGHTMPLFGLGVFNVGSGQHTRNAVMWALDAGYRLIDTAAIYGNEWEVGEAIRTANVAREEVFVTTKLWNSEHGYDQAIAACENSLTKMGLDYVDLYLIHWPVEKLRMESWRALVTLRDRGICRSIGVSNYTIQHLDQLVKQSEVMPAVNQVEFNPYLFQKELLVHCRELGIQLEGYCPLVRGKYFADRLLVDVAKRNGRTVAQVLIRWALQRQIVTIPRTARPERVLENADVFCFHLGERDMVLLDGLNQNKHITWDPTHVA